MSPLWSKRSLLDCFGHTGESLPSKQGFFLLDGLRGKGGVRAYQAGPCSPSQPMRAIEGSCPSKLDSALGKFPRGLGGGTRGRSLPGG